MPQDPLPLLPGQTRPLAEAVGAEKRTLPLELDAEEARALVQLIDNLFARASPPGSMIEETIQNAFRWDGSDSLKEPVTRALYKVMTQANHPVPSNLSHQDVNELWK